LNASPTTASRIGLVSVVEVFCVRLAHLALSDRIIKGSSLGQIAEKHAIFELLSIVAGMRASIRCSLFVRGAMTGCTSISSFVYLLV
jgi:hypothetical protein